MQKRIGYETYILWLDFSELEVLYLRLFFLCALYKMCENIIVK